MTDEEMRKLSRNDLLDIIYEMKLNEQRLLSRLDEAEMQVQNREIHIEEAGSIAEAALKLNNVFEAAQAAADQYVENLAKANEERDQIIKNAEQEGARILMQARQKANEMLRAAEVQSCRMVKKAEEESVARWDVFQGKVNELLKAHSELKALLKSE